MAALEEGGKYGLSCSRPTETPKSAVLVRLTDSALRALEEYQTLKGTHQKPSIQFRNNEGVITVPVRKSEENPQGTKTFKFTLSSAQQGVTECVQQGRRSLGDTQLQQVNNIQQKLTVHATDDVYQTTRQRVTQVEEEWKKNQTKVLDKLGPKIGRKVKIKHPSQPIPPSRKHTKSAIHSSSFRIQKQTAKQRTLHSVSTASKPSPSVNSSRNNHERQTAVSKRPCRERVVHLLAMKPYKKPELILRLNKDGISDKTSLPDILKEIATLGKDDNYTLNKATFSDVQEDWPFYTSEERQLVKRRLAQMRQSPSCSPTTTTHDSPPSLQGSSQQPVQASKRPLDSLDQQVAAKKPRVRISANTGALGSQNCAINSQAFPVQSNEATSTQSTPSPDSQVDDRFDVKAFDKKEEERAQRKREKTKAIRSANGKDRKVKDAPSSPSANEQSVATSTSEMPTYISHYPPISKYDQRQSYKMDFNREYEEYKQLYANIQKVSQRFSDLEAELRKLPEGSNNYKRIQKQVLQEYDKIQAVSYTRGQRTALN
ncbi:PREDICTED: RNA polymerase II elongation factor ELL-like [Branchiostoma belcheri]|uniref:RNA polymerase II elongation factor ELL-like n=1 Tax=Branchiostoma belcheri TaxID=7741 RepID=A0A6P4XV93_BRABE|nr:PREDICTED: RNA polymerase II elongation factor ELL-like [Branchiostoma belcheri]